MFAMILWRSWSVKAHELTMGSVVDINVGVALLTRLFRSSSFVCRRVEALKASAEDGPFRAALWLKLRPIRQVRRARRALAALQVRVQVSDLGR